MNDCENLLGATHHASFHHVGCAVRDVEAGLRAYRELLGERRRSRVFEVSSQDVGVCFLELAGGGYLEFVEARGSISPLDRFLEVGFYHLCFLVGDRRAALERLERAGFTPLAPFLSEAFDGRTCQFILTPETHLIELVEMTPEAFAAFFARNIC